MKNDLIIGGLCLLLLAGLLGAVYSKGYVSGKREARAEMQKKVDEQTAKVAKLEADDRKRTADAERDILLERERHAKELSDARAVIQPVRLCKPIRSSAVPITAGPAA